jgi:hypothetical protein
MSARRVCTLSGLGRVLFGRRWRRCTKVLWTVTAAYVTVRCKESNVEHTISYATSLLFISLCSRRLLCVFDGLTQSVYVQDRHYKKFSANVRAELADEESAAARTHHTLWHARMEDVKRIRSAMTVRVRAQIDARRARSWRTQRPVTAVSPLSTRRPRARWSP